MGQGRREPRRHGAPGRHAPATRRLAHPGVRRQVPPPLQTALARRLPATVLADEIALLVALAAVTGLAALLAWQSLFPSRRDYLSLAGLPIRSRQIFGARFAAVAIFATALTVALTLLPCIVTPFEFGGRWQENPSY